MAEFKKVEDGRIDDVVGKQVYKYLSQKLYELYIECNSEKESERLSKLQITLEKNNKKNLNLFRRFFSNSSLKLNTENMKRLQIKYVESKYASKRFSEFILNQSEKTIALDKKIVAELIVRRDRDSKVLEHRLDYFSIILGFEGVLDAIYFDFDPSKKEEALARGEILQELKDAWHLLLQEQKQSILTKRIENREEELTQRRLEDREDSIDFTPFIKERTDNFVGRVEVQKEYQKFLLKYESGYFVASGKPGMGKSAFMAYLAQSGLPIHHFINSDRDGKNTPLDVMRNITSCLEREYNVFLDSFTLSDEMNIDSASILKRVSENLQPHQNCIILIDGIDELSGYDTLKKTKDVNIFHFPKRLPKGIYIVLSIRERDELSLKAMNETHYEFLPDSEENQKDIRAYIHKFLQKDGIISFMQKNGLDSFEFENLLAEKTEGNFMYLHCVLPQIELGYYKDVKFEEIPSGLNPYYEDHWNRMKGVDEKGWFEYKLPIISVLTLSGMSLSTEMIRQYANLQKGAQVIAVLEDWKQFFYKKDVGLDFLGISIYTLYHTSFKDFLNQKSLVQAEQVDIKRFVKDFIIKNQETYNPTSEDEAENLLNFHKMLRGDNQKD